MTDQRSKTRELLEKLASTEYRRSVRADQIFRTLRDEPPRNDNEPKKVAKA
ncbi:hypothetical protein [Parvularcula lutaonensis]|uniref:Uncharacterized protein n=1 Tax=Parvularcula lutaonensis TaxID=491923 RepID=A0ABV7MFW7_9PROT|nr:hypothetical protein [Parvularcula lutaonensis]